MEGPDVDWKIEEAQSDVEWILRKGLSLGKNVVVTGFVISSAPLVLPSIVIVSTIGFVVSIPFGLVFASYACSQKLMNMLLPMPTSSSLLEHEKMVEHQDEEGEQYAKGSGSQVVDIEEDEKGRIEESGEATEKTIESDENESKLAPAKEGDEKNEDVKDTTRDDEERMANEGESVENKGYEKSVQEEDQMRPGDETDVKIEGEGEEAEKGPGEGSEVKIEGEEEEAKKGPTEEESKEEEPLPEQEEKVTADDAAKEKEEEEKNKGGEEKSQAVEGKNDNTNVGTVKESENPVENGNNNGKTLDQGTTEEDNAKGAETNSAGQNINGAETGKST